MIIWIDVTRPPHAKYGLASISIRGDLIHTMQHSEKAGAEGTWITFTNHEKLLVIEDRRTIQDQIETKQMELVDRHAHQILHGVEAIPTIGVGPASDPLV